MDTTGRIQLIEVPIGGSGGDVWSRLHSEREDICEAMLKDCEVKPEVNGEAAAPSDEANANWHHDLLQARLRKIDTALDRLMSGSYGNCSKCGKWIEDTKLAFDPAIEFCLSCWDRERNKMIGLSLGKTQPRQVNPVIDSSTVELPLNPEPARALIVYTGLPPACAAANGPGLAESAGSGAGVAGTVAASVKYGVAGNTPYTDT